MMKIGEFINSLDDAAIISAIKESELRTSGKIRVFVSKRNRSNDGVYTKALKEFKKLGMHKTEERNAVLVYIAPETRELAIVADEGIQSKSGALPWRQVIKAYCSDMKLRGMTVALVNAINSIGKTLAIYYPRN